MHLKLTGQKCNVKLWPVEGAVSYASLSTLCFCHSWLEHLLSRCHPCTTRRKWARLFFLSTPRPPPEEKKNHPHNSNLLLNSAHLFCSHLLLSVSLFFFSMLRLFKQVYYTQKAVSKAKELKVTECLEEAPRTLLSHFSCPHVLITFLIASSSDSDEVLSYFLSTFLHYDPTVYFTVLGDE